jgi:hypothetical protein
MNFTAESAEAAEEKIKNWKASANSAVTNNMPPYGVIAWS